MRFFTRALTDPETGLSVHRPLVGWTFAILLGTAFGFFLGYPFPWLIIATGTLLLSWKPSPWRSLMVCLCCLALTAWRAAHLHDENERTLNRLHEAQQAEHPLLLQGTVAPDVYTVRRKNGAPYARFSLQRATFEDGTPVTGVNLRATYYDADGPLPKMGERWTFPAKLRPNPWYNTFNFTAYGAPDPETLPHQVAPPQTTLNLPAEDFFAQSRPNLFPMVTTLGKRTIVERKRGRPYARYLLEKAWIDGAQIEHPKITLYYYDPAGNFPNEGETWHLPVKLRKSSSARSLMFSTHVEPLHPSATHLYQADEGHRLQYQLMRIRERLAQNLALGVSPEEALCTQTMTLGSEQRLPRADRERYADAGIIHIFSISGLHVGIIAGLLLWLFAHVGLRLRLRAFLICPALIGYLLLTGCPPSATRACIMALLYCFAPSLFRRADASCALLATAAVVLLIEPAWIANIGALLSFTVMGGILLYMRPFTYFLNRLMRAQPQRTARGEFPLFTPWHLQVRQKIALLMALTLSAWIASLPLCLFFFGRLSIVGIVLNLFVPTLCVIIVWTSCISAFIGFVLPLVATLLNRFNAFLLQVINTFSDTLLQYEWALLELDTPISCSVTLLSLGFLLCSGLYLRALEKRLRYADPRDTLVKR